MLAEPEKLPDIYIKEALSTKKRFGIDAY